MYIALFIMVVTIIELEILRRMFKKKERFAIIRQIPIFYIDDATMRYMLLTCIRVARVIYLFLIFGVILLNILFKRYGIM